MKVDRASGEEKAGSDVDAAPRPHIDHGHGGATIHIISEAYAVEEDDGVVVDASRVRPVVPWWEQKRSILYTWTLLCFFSAIALAAYETNPDYNPKEYNEAWPYYPYLTRAVDAFVTTCCSLSLSLSGLASSIHFAGDSAIGRHFVGTIVKGAMSLGLATMWIIALFTLMEPNSGLAIMWVEEVNGDAVHPRRLVMNDANLFFSS